MHEAAKTLKAEMKKRKETGESELMDLLIAYKHEEMFRLDGNYYAEYAKSKGMPAIKPVDERYLSGKYTSKMKFFAKGANAGKH